MDFPTFFNLDIVLCARLFLLSKSVIALGLPAASFSWVSICVSPLHMQAEALDSIACTFVPADVKDACDGKVDAAVRHAVQLFEDYVSPATVCRPACPEAGMQSGEPRLLSSRYPDCAQCQYNAMELANGESDAACTKLPEPFVADCSRFVENNGKP